MDGPGELRRAMIDSTAGAISGAISRTFTSPLDVMKIRFQVQLEPTTSWALLQKDLSRPSKYTGMHQAAKDIFRDEGLPGFWRGNVPALLMVMPYTAIQFTVLHKLKTLATGSSNPENHRNLSPYQSFVNGGLAGCVATVGSYPFDLLRTVLASQGEPKVYLNMRSAFIDIARTRGFLGLYAGLQPTLVEIFLYAGLQFGTFETCRHWAREWNCRRYPEASLSTKEDGLSNFQIFICGLAGGSTAKFACHPLDVVKKRFQIAGVPRHPKYGVPVEHHAYRNMFDAIGKILKSEGMAGLYKGIVPSVVKAAPTAAVTLVAYECVLAWLLSR